MTKILQCLGRYNQWPQVWLPSSFLYCFGWSRCLLEQRSSLATYQLEARHKLHRLRIGQLSLDGLFLFPMQPKSKKNI